MNACMLCRNDHADIVCDCGHHHNDHVFAVGCCYDLGVVINGQKLKCECSRYSQKHLRKETETNAQFRRRTLGSVDSIL